MSMLYERIDEPISGTKHWSKRIVGWLDKISITTIAGLLLEAAGMVGNTSSFRVSMNFVLSW